MAQLKLSPSSKKISVKSFKGKSQKGIFVNGKQLTSIKSKVITIEKLLGKENSMLKKQLETQRKQTQTQKRKATEDKFEKKPNPKKEEKKAFSMPRIGFLERVKNFMVFVQKCKDFYLIKYEESTFFDFDIVVFRFCVYAAC